ncbi:UPAR/Ly6 domain-containing protein cold-like [Ornithodoros turicata]|uniref:UPAR/Ly6 domain-containing protein cold-like n=1 Tax=Ornithodoros turicata TaxID=34597 RepID=UPI00313875D0
MLRLLILSVICITNIYCLECYICERQDNNNEKCTATINTCDPGQERCLTEVRWGSTPYWAPTGEKQYYISKQCATEEMCRNMTQKYKSRCDRIWYNDWECSECCTGDRCNYYVTLGSNSLQTSFWLYLVPSMLLLLTVRRQW